MTISTITCIRILATIDCQYIHSIIQNHTKTNKFTTINFINSLKVDRLFGHSEVPYANIFDAITILLLFNYLCHNFIFILYIYKVSEQRMRRDKRESVLCSV